MIRPLGIRGVFTDGEELYTRNLVPGATVYGEPLVRTAGGEFRLWDPHRSKLAAYVRLGGTAFPFTDESTVLYLGAATGTTVSHVSDLCPSGAVHAVEISRRAFEKLLRLSETRPNLVPILGDAAKPETFRGLLGGPVDVVYQDVAQPAQDAIFLRNLEVLAPSGTGFLAVKARSVDVARRPTAVFEDARTSMERAGHEVLDARSLHPFQRDHAMVVVRTAAAGAQR